MKSTLTPIPWRVEGPKHEGYAASLMGADGSLVANFGDGGNGRKTHLVNAEHIAYAINNRDALLNQLSRYELVLWELIEDVNAVGPKQVGKDWPDISVTYNKAKAALALREDY